MLLIQTDVPDAMKNVLLIKGIVMKIMHIFALFAN